MNKNDFERSRNSDQTENRTAQFFCRESVHLQSTATWEVMQPEKTLGEESLCDSTPVWQDWIQLLHCTWKGGGLDITRRWEKYHCTAQPQFDKTGFSCFTAHTKTTYFLFWWNAVMPSLRQAVQWYFYQRVLWTHLSLPVDCKWLLHCRLKTTYFLVFGEILSCQTWSKLYSDPSTNSECFLLGHGAL